MAISRRDLDKAERFVKKYGGRKNLSATRRGKVAICEAILHNGGRITATRDHTVRRGWWR